MQTDRLPRLLRLVTLLQSRRGYGVSELTDELEISRRTLFRDFEALGAARVPYHYDPERKGYFIRGEFFLPPVQLTFNETIALSVLASQLARQRQIPFLDDAWRGMMKLEEQIPASIRQELSVLDGGLFVQTARTSPQDGCADTFQIIRQSLAQRRKVRCVYEDGDGFLFHPYAVQFSQRAWYVVGYSEKRGQERCLKLNRIRHVDCTDHAYEIPQGWTLEKHLGKAWRMIRGATRYSVAVRFDAEFARNVADTLWHPTQKITWEDDGTCVFECEVDGLAEIVWWVLAYGPHAQVIRPAELRDQVRQLAQKTAQQYAASEPAEESPWDIAI